MILNSVLLFSYLFFCAISVIGYGYLTIKFLKIDNNFFNIGEIGLLGFFSIFGISVFVHFFIPLYQYLNLTVLFIGILFFLNFFNQIKKNFLVNNYLYYLIPIILLPSIIVIRTHADYEWYHLPYINYLNNFKIIFGLANFSNNLSFGHGWQDIIAIFSIPLIETKGLTALGMIFYFFYILTLIKYIEKENKQNKIIIFIILFYSLSVFNNLIDFGAEAQPVMLMILFGLNSIFITTNKNEKFMLKILFYFIFALFLRIGSVVFLPTFLILFVLYFKLFLNLISNNLRPIMFTILILFLVLFRNFIHSGCLIFPIPSTCFNNDNIKWAVPLDNVNERYYVQSSKAKGYEFYIKSNGPDEHLNLYYNKILNNQIEHPQKYSTDILLWPKYWFLDHDKDRIINIIIIVFTCFIILIFSKKEKIVYVKNKEQSLLLISFFLSTLFWFYTSPQTRYGGIAIIAVTCLYLLYYFFLNFKIDNKKLKIISNIIIFIPLIYVSVKNYNRISNFNIDDFQKFPYPNYKEYKLNKEYVNYSINNFNINLKKHTKGEVLGEPIRCGNIDMICIPEPLKVCIDNIEIIYDYIIVINSGKKCLDQYKNNYWQH